MQLKLIPPHYCMPTFCRHIMWQCIWALTFSPNINKVSVGAGVLFIGPCTVPGACLALNTCLFDI